MTIPVCGLNARDNFDLILGSKQDHWWFHLNSFPSPHVVFRDPILEYDDIIESAMLCKSKSKYKNIRNVKIVYTPISNVRLTDVIGQVTFVSKRKCKFIVI